MLVRSLVFKIVCQNRALYARGACHFSEGTIQKVFFSIMAPKSLRLHYDQKGYPQAWIDERLEGMSIRQELMDEWLQRGLKKNHEFSHLTNLIYERIFGLKSEDYKSFKNLPKQESLRDHMSLKELKLVSSAEKTVIIFYQKREVLGFKSLKLATQNALDFSREGVVTRDNFLHLSSSKMTKH
jgi:hypothetical protein